MLGLRLNIERNTPVRVLFLGAHSDDIEIGCGGTIFELIDRYPRIMVTWIVFGSDGQRSVEAEDSAVHFLKTVKDKTIVIKNFRDGFFPYRGEAIKDYFELIKRDLSPDIIFTHYRHDLHQDHRLICELTWNTFRDHLILEYEIPKFDGDLGSPNVFVSLDENLCNRKIEHILTHFKTQDNRHWFSAETFMSLLRLRGIEARSPTRYAEGFYCRKMVF